MLPMSAQGNPSPIPPANPSPALLAFSVTPFWKKISLTPQRRRRVETCSPHVYHRPNSQCYHPIGSYNGKYPPSNARLRLNPQLHSRGRRRAVIPEINPLCTYPSYPRQWGATHPHTSTSCIAVQHRWRSPSMSGMESQSQVGDVWRCLESVALATVRVFKLAD